MRATAIQGEAVTFLRGVTVILSEAEGSDRTHPVCTRERGESPHWNDPATLGIVPGIQKFVQGVQEFVQGVQKFVQGVQEFVQGVQKFVQGVQKFVQGVQEFVQGVQEFVQGVQEFVQGVQEFVQGVPGNDPLAPKFGEFNPATDKFS